ncbi:hypothetical protein NDU88_003551 [Pleurodeles waltl]|uniref:Uncharacterized protein n=1 Tax=Pleurodeles waltl TaxID=8319 RepID=A0AAV7WPR3_PLEWA|nr:hypothetical protein NDU88_003551 [Pleurodeles waltl]
MPRIAAAAAQSHYQRRRPGPSGAPALITSAIHPARPSEPRRRIRTPILCTSGRSRHLRRSGPDTSSASSHVADPPGHGPCPSQDTAFRLTGRPKAKPSIARLRLWAPPSEAYEQRLRQQAQPARVSNAPISSGAPLNPMAGRGPRSPAPDLCQAARLSTGFKAG